MNTEIKKLFVDSSTMPSAGKGLFTSENIKKGELIIEYTGEVTNWEEVRHDADNVYIYFVNEDYVINAKNDPDAIARYANDARGLTRIKDVHNNSKFVKVEGRIFIKASKLIKAGEEIFVDYGKDYWDTVKKKTRNYSNKNRLPNM